MKTRLLSEITSCLESGSRPKGGVSNVGDVVSIGGEHLDGKGGFRFESIKRISEAFYSALKAGRVQPNDILIVKDGATTGKVSFIDTFFPFSRAAVNEHVFRLKVNETYADPKFIFHYLSSPIGQRQILSDFRGATVGGIGRTFLERVRIPLPSLEEQRRVATALDQALIVKRKRRMSLEMLENLRGAYFIETFGTPSTNPKNWPVKAFSDVCKNEDGLRVPVRSSDRETRKGRYPYYGASGIIDHVDDFLFDGERLLIGEDGANLLARSSPVAFIASGRYWVNNHAHVLAANGKAELRYLEYFINLIDLAPYVSGSAQPKLNQANLNRIPVPIPPGDLQAKFVSFLQGTDRVIATANASASRISSLCSYLQSRAFSGAE